MDQEESYGQQRDQEIACMMVIGRAFKWWIFTMILLVVGLFIYHEL